MSEINASNFKKEHGDLAPDLVGVTELTSPYFFVPPSGTTAERPEDCEPGTLRFNTDIGSLEVFRGNTIGWEQIQRRESQYLGGGTGSNLGTGTRGLIHGGQIYNPNTYINNIDFLTISTFGNTQDFGDMDVTRRHRQSICNHTRLVIPGGFNGSGYMDEISFVNINSTGNASDFGDLIGNKFGGGTVNNKTRGIIGSGQNSDGSPYYTNVIEYVTIAQTGNSVDFGDGGSDGRPCKGCSSSTRGLFGADGFSPADVIFVTMSTLGNASDFGNVEGHKAGGGGASSATRCIWSGDYFGNSISFMTMATLGNSINFGDLDVSRDDPTGMSSPTRGVIAGGRTIPSYRVISSMSAIEIATTGNAVDFGDITYLGDGTDNNENSAAAANGHGGL